MAGQIDWHQVQPERKWTILGKQRRFALWALWSSIGCVMFGFDLQSLQMGIPYPSQPSGYLIQARIQAAWFGASIAGDVVGVAIAGQILDIIGRKHTIGIGTALTAVGVGVQVASHKWEVFLAGRLINALGFGMVFIVCPVWIGENVRPELRGFFLCITNASIVFGQFVLSLAAYGAAKIAGKWSYLTLIILQFAFVGALGLGYPFFPESPFFLLKKNNQIEKARKALVKIHGSSDQSLIEAELQRLQQTVAVTEEMKQLAGQSGPPILQCFKKKDLKRTLIACLPIAAQQLIGAAFVLGYITYFMSLLGVFNFFEVTVILSVIMLLSNVAAFFFIEQAGRRWILFWGMVILTAVELLMGIMGFVKTPGALWVILVSIFLWAIAYQFTIGAIGYAFAAEIPTPRLRAPTLSLIGITNGAFGWLIGFVSPYMINPDAGNLGAKVGFVFAGLGVPLCVLIFFFVPETRGLSFDELDYLFYNKVSCRHFQRVVKEYRAQGLLAAPGEHDVKTESATVTELERSSPE